MAPNAEPAARPWPALDPAGFPPMPLPPGRERGPDVFLGYDQAELDVVYDQKAYAPRLAQVQARNAICSEEARHHLGEPRRLAYGAAPIEGLDLYPADCAAGHMAPVVVFIHGGAWREGTSREFGFPAELFVGRRVHFVVADFTNVLETGGDLMPMFLQVQSALAWVVRNAASFGGDPRRVYACAHSAGAHLAAATLTADWGAHGLPQDALRGALLCSGMYDLAGPSLSSRRSYVNFTAEVVGALSAQRHIDRLAVPVVLVYGSLETPEFQRQTWEFARAVRRAGKPVELIRAEGYDHFEILETLGSPYGVLGRAMLAMLGTDAEPRSRL